MKLSLLPLILSAGLAVSAAPIRVVVVTEQASRPPSFVRVGHAAAYNAPALPNIPVMPPAEVPTGQPIFPTTRVMKHKGGCAGSRRLKALKVKVADWFRAIFGLPAHQTTKPIGFNNISAEYNVHSLPRPHGMIIHGPNGKIHFVNTPPESHHHHHHHAHTHHKRPKAFVQRLTRALMMLGPWEGRIVSFVLGCGIGVLLRIVWVLGVLAIRSIRGKKQEDEFLADEVIFEEHEYLLPPQYAEVAQDTKDVKEKAETEPVAAAAAATA